MSRPRSPNRFRRKAFPAYDDLPGMDDLHGNPPETDVLANGRTVPV
ncbi:hypothetical protein [Muriventricola aceti]|nr:hypothetical protein [Clostridiales bacterium]